jgi:hypothetical protein
LLAAGIALAIVRRVASPSVRRAATDLMSEIKVAVCHRQGLGAFPRLIREGTRLNMGCGQRLRSGWTNVDIVPPADVRLDIRRPLPLPDGYCSEIYAEHVLEHLRFPGEVEHVLEEWHRVLQSNGTLCVGVPDTRGLARAYVDNAGSCFAELAAADDAPPWAETPLDHVSFHFRQQSLAFGQDHSVHS